MVINYILGQILDLMGGDFKHFKRFMFEEDPEAVVLYQLATGAKGAGSTPNQNMMPTQNQFALPQGGQEQAARAMGGM